MTERYKRREARTILAIECLNRMKQERCYKALQHGKDIKISDLSKHGDDLLQVLTEIKNEWTTGQYTLPFESEPQELILHRVHPITPDPTPEEKHLAEVRLELKTLI